MNREQAARIQKAAQDFRALYLAYLEAELPGIGQDDLVSLLLLVPSGNYGALYARWSAW